MSEGLPARAFLWGAATGMVLLAWPWLLNRLAARRPTWLAAAGIPAPPDLVIPSPPAARALIGWTLLVLAAALLPVGNGWHAASLDAGLLWLAALALAGVALPGRASPALAGGVVTLTLCLAPLVVRTGSLHLGDLGIAQHGGVGNWFVLRDPFLLMAATVALLTAGALWPADEERTGGWFTASLAAGLPLVLAHLVVVAFLGAWWSFVPALDRLSWLNTGVKVLAVLLAMGWLRSRRPRWCEPSLLVWRLPLAGLVSCVGAVIWLAATGAAR